MTHFMAIDKKQPADGPGSHWPCSGKEHRPSFEIWVICDLSQECLTLKNIQSDPQWTLKTLFAGLMHSLPH